MFYFSNQRWFIKKKTELFFKTVNYFKKEQRKLGNRRKHLNQKLIEILYQLKWNLTRGPQSKIRLKYIEINEFE